MPPAGAGPEAGFYAIPDVGDEVLVAFEQGHISRPYVLGGLWNGKHAIPPTAADVPDNKKPAVRTWQSRKGHSITLIEEGDEKIEIKTAAGITITLDDKEKKITVAGSDDVEIKAGNNLTLEASSNITIKAGGEMNIEATSQANIKGQMVNIN